MDNLTHSLVGLTSAKAGLERLSPYATLVCVVSANAADADFASLFFGDRWTLLRNHRGITHSILGTVVIGLLVPLIAFAIERLIAARRNRPRRIRLRGLLIASCVAAATHPLMDWTNNYGIRPLLPWNGKWFYGDLVFIVDPYIWLLLAGVAFLLTSDSRPRIGAWAILGSVTTALIIVASLRAGADGSALVVARTIWIIGIIALIALRVVGMHKRIGPRFAFAALLMVAAYWGGLEIAHRSAYARTAVAANQFALARGETVAKLAAMPTLATPLRWQSVVETDRAVYRFTIELNNGATPDALTRYQKPTGEEAELIAIAERDRRAQVLLGFARFPLATVDDGNCIGQTVVQFADLRYTQPGSAGRGNFSVNIPVDCPQR